ncbi:MAG: RrF2 family transcriptional regulator [Planctomycetota bacterium]
MRLVLDIELRRTDDTMVVPNRLSQKCRYALRAMFELALRNTSQPVKVQEIASAQAIPPRFLEVILAELRHAGFVESRRGSDGGYLLARPADDLSVGEVIAFLQGVRQTGALTRQNTTDIAGNYVFSRMWEMVSTAISDIYNNTTFADLVAEELAERRIYIPNYTI